MTRRLAIVAAVIALVALCSAASPAAAAPGPSSAPEWWFDSWHVPELWASGARGQGVTIAEIDTGVNAQLPELSGRIVAGTDLGQGGNGQIDRQVKSFGHGTAMASLMVARPGLLGITGLAPDAQILPVAVPLNGTSDAGAPDKLDTAIRYAADHGAKVISMSVGGKRSETEDSEPCPAEEQEAVYHALAKGSIVIASVGNTGPNDNTVEEPAVCLGVVSVGAVDIHGKVADFSAREPYLSLVAPGVNIPSLGRVEGDAFAGDGTSQATALASASAALVWSAHPQLSGEQVVTRLLRTLDGRRSTASSSYGYGQLDTYAAVTADVPATATNPVFEGAAPFLRREAAFNTRSGPAAPTPAPTKLADTGPVTVGDPSSTDRQTVLGLAALGAGVVALALLVVGAARRRRLRRLRAAAIATSFPSAPSPAAPGPSAPGPSAPGPSAPGLSGE